MPGLGVRGKNFGASAFGSGGRPRRLAASSAPDPRFSSFARWGGPVLCGAPTTPVAGPHSRGRKAWPCPLPTLRVPSPHTKQVHPIEHLAPASPTVQALGWRDSRERAEMAPPGPTVQALGRWAGADLTAAGLAPQGPSVQGLALWVGAGPDGSRAGTAGSECPGAGLVGWGGPDGGRDDTGRSECPRLSRWAETDLAGAGVALWAGAELTEAGLVPLGPRVQGLTRRGWGAPVVPSVQGLIRWDGADLAEVRLAPLGLSVQGSAR
ncbi:hypothetical protein LV75_000845 [Actinokineospora diospyrosa]|uniref:Uncharacterized protein n=1 Tax=Actinokineospora diospyrosa TaxID=103728 RepID=A0ABT1I6V9_9PSEU|nr:hypothetical protein [Actinokineospora diospyrosa]